MTSESEYAEMDDLEYGYEFFHPIHILGYWIDKFFERISRPEFLKPSKTLKPDPSANQIIRSDEGLDEYSWSSERVKALAFCQNAHEAAIDINRWLRYGLGERAGRLETDFRSILFELTAILEHVTEPKKFETTYHDFHEHACTLSDRYAEIGHAAINPDDGALEEWFSVVDAMRTALGEVLSVHSILHRIVFKGKRGRIGDSMYRYMVAGSDFESLLPQVRSQMRRGSDQEYDRANRLPRLCAHARWSFEEILTKNKLPPGSFPADIHQQLRQEGSYFHRKLELTLAERPKANQPRILWTLGIACSPAQHPSWNKNLRELRFGGEVCKRFKTRAENQERVLQAFQEENWPPRIDDPLPPGKLHETVRQLNKTSKLVKFMSDGYGEGICWELRTPPK